MSVLDPNVPPVVPAPMNRAQQEGKKILRSFSQGNSATKKIYAYMVVGLVVILVGGLTGKLLAGGGTSKRAPWLMDVGRITVLE